MPSFRREIIQHAQAKDIALGKDKVQELPNGSYEDAVKKALGQLPSDLQALINYCLPVSPQFEPRERKNENDDEQDDELGKDTVEFFKWAGENLHHEKGDTTLDERKWATNCISTWCWFMKELKDKHKKM